LIFVEEIEDEIVENALRDKATPLLHFWTSLNQYTEGYIELLN